MTTSRPRHRSLLSWLTGSALALAFCDGLAISSRFETRSPLLLFALFATAVPLAVGFVVTLSPGRDGRPRVRGLGSLALLLSAAGLWVHCGAHGADTLLPSATNSSAGLWPFSFESEGRAGPSLSADGLAEAVMLVVIVLSNALSARIVLSDLELATLDHGARVGAAAGWMVAVAQISAHPFWYFSLGFDAMVQDVAATERSGVPVLWLAFIGCGWIVLSALALREALRAWRWNRRWRAKLDAALEDARVVDETSDFAGTEPVVAMRGVRAYPKVLIESASGSTTYSEPHSPAAAVGTLPAEPKLASETLGNRALWAGVAIALLLWGIWRATCIVAGAVLAPRG